MKVKRERHLKKIGHIVMNEDVDAVVFMGS